MFKRLIFVSLFFCGGKPSPPRRCPMRVPARPVFPR